MLILVPYEYVINKEQEVELEKETAEFKKYLDSNSIPYGLDITDETRKLFWNYQTKLNEKLINKYVDYIYNKSIDNHPMSKTDFINKQIKDITKQTKEYFEEDIRNVSKVKEIGKKHGLSEEEMKELYETFESCKQNTFSDFDFIASAYLYKRNLKHAMSECENQCKIAIKEHINFLRENDYMSKSALKRVSFLVEETLSLLGDELSSYITDCFVEYDSDSTCEKFLETFSKALRMAKFLSESK